MKARWLVLPLLAGFAVPFVVPALADNQSVSAEASSFDPKFVAVKPGEKVTWSNIPPSGPHNVKFDDGSFEMPDDSQQFTPWTVERTFETPGEYRYHCEVHGGPGGVGMSGIVYVNDAGTVPTQTQTQPTNTTPTNTGTTPTNTTPTNTTGTNTTTTDPPPSIASVRPGASTFCTRRSRTCRRPGLRFTVELSEAAELRGVVRRLRRARGAATRRSFTRAGKQGRNVVKVSARGLAPGRYRLTLRAVDAGGNSSPPITSTFKVRR